MALTMLEKTSEHADKSAWPPTLIAEFERERASNNPCVGNMLVSESERVRVWMIKLAPGERFGFHRHVLDYFWTCVTGGRGRSTSTTAPRSNIAMRRARPATRLTGPASSRFMIWKISAIRRWSS